MPLVRVGRSNIQVSHSMRYLGVMIDGSWNFREHLRYIEVKATKVVKALSRLMPNLRGPGERKRQLYATVLKSVVMYASPIWGEKFASYPDRVTRPLRRLQRTMAIRTTTSYRTASFDAVTLLARSPPWKLEATLRSRIYSRFQDCISRNEFSKEAEAEIRKGETLLMMRQWDIMLSNPNAWGVRTTAAIRSHMSKWMDRKFGEINYYITQLFTSHGSFGHFPSKIEKRQTAECYHCAASDDTVEHTIFDCPSWEVQRTELLHKLDLRNEEGISLEQIVGKILENKENKERWSSFSQFRILGFEAEGGRRETTREDLSFSPIIN